MIKAETLKLYMESTADFKKKIGKELRAIDKGRAKKMPENSISFQSIDQLRKFLTSKRLELLRVIRYKKPKSIYELAKMVKRTPENVNTYIKFLERLGFVEVTKIKDVREKSVPEVSYDRMTLEIAV